MVITWIRNYKVPGPTLTSKTHLLSHDAAKQACPESITEKRKIVLDGTNSYMFFTLKSFSMSEVWNIYDSLLIISLMWEIKFLPFYFRNFAFSVCFLLKYTKRKKKKINRNLNNRKIFLTPLLTQYSKWKKNSSFFWYNKKETEYRW